MDKLIILFIVSTILIILNFIMWHFKFLYKCLNELINKIRNISRAENIGGYLKLIQIIFVAPLIILFVLTFVYFWINDSDKVSPITVIFTVIVGWLGFIIARFFGEKAMELTSEQHTNIGEMQEIIDDYENRVSESEEIIDGYVEKTGSLLDYINNLKNKLKLKNK